jgi:hypothetical protein
MYYYLVILIVNLNCCRLSMLDLLFSSSLNLVEISFFVSDV